MARTRKTRKADVVPVADPLDEVVGVAEATEAEAEVIVAEAEASVAEAEEPTLPVRVGVVSLAEQDAELARMGVRVLEGEVVESSGDAAVSGLPWENWSLPETVDFELGHLRVETDGRDLLLAVPGFDPAPINETVWGNLSWSANFPAEWVKTLTPTTATAVLNERIQKYPQRPLRAVREGGEILSLIPARREFVPSRVLAETVWDALTEYGLVELKQETPEEPHYRAGSLLLRFLTPVRHEVTRRRGDVIRMGVEVSQTYGAGIDLALYVERLVCINGMVAGHQEIAFKQNNLKVAEQIEWLKEKVAALPPIFDRLALQASAMAGREIGENVLIPDALREFARRNGIQGRLVPLANRAWEEMNREEESVGRNEWDLSNAFTRALRDLPGEWSRDARFRNSLRVGEWVRGDELVLARLRRRDAERVGAEIQEPVAV